MRTRQHSLSTRLAAAGAMASMGCACTVDGNGMLYADVRGGGDATVVHLVAVGLQLRTRADDPGISLGVSERTYIFPTFGTDRLPSLGQHYLHVNLPEHQSLAVASFTTGAELSLSGYDVDLGIGLSQRVVMARLPADKNTAFSIGFDLDAAEQTRVQIHCGWTIPCP